MATSALSLIRADQALRQCGHPALRQIHIEESEREIVLSGSVNSYYHKQLAQETIMPVLGARELRNQIKVVAS
jgi:hypothetical protein